MSELAIGAKLAAVDLKNDDRVKKAKELLVEALREKSDAITSVRPPQESLESEYSSLLEKFGAIRGNNLFFPYLSSGIGNGPFIELADGSVKLDFITGIGVHGFGHSHPMLVEAGVDAIITDTVMQGNLQQGSDSYEIAKLLTETACESGAKLKHCFLSTSGAMANENSLKMAFQKNAPANRVIAFEHCFAGRTLALSQLTDKAKNRVGLPETIAVDYIPFFDPDDPKGSTERSLGCLKELVHRYPGKHALLWMELIQGEGGYYPGDKNFFRKLVDFGHRNNIAFIADEVQTFGRTTRPFAFQHFELDDVVDIVTIGKISQVCATLFTDEYKPKPGLISQTFTGSSWAIVAGHRILSGLIENGHYGADGKNQRLFEKFAGGLKDIASRHPDAISGPYGCGGMVAFTPFDGTMKKTRELVTRLYHAGLMSFSAGAAPVRIRFLMPIGCVTDDHIDLACQILEQTIVEIKNDSK